VNFYRLDMIHHHQKLLIFPKIKNHQDLKISKANNFLHLKMKIILRIPKAQLMNIIDYLLNSLLNFKMKIKTVILLYILMDLFKIVYINIKMLKNL
jgi:hypothetical protein